MTNRDKHLVIGLGVTGQALIRYFLDQGISCVGFDEYSGDSYKEAVSKFSKKAEFYFKKLPKSVFGSLKRCFVSPGVPLTRSWVQEAKKRSIPVTGELEFASQLLQGSIIAVTGTNGKSTTVSLLHSILKRGGIRTSLKGNIGFPLITAVSEPPQDYYVIEVSSFQLETIEKFHPKISIVLNVSEDHLDRYDSLENYAKAKARIFMNQQKSNFLIYNADDPLCMRMVKHAPATCIPFSLINRQKMGGFVDVDEMVVKLDGKEEERYPIENTSLKGLHNQENMLAAILAATLIDVSHDSIANALNNFKSLNHRLENIGKFRGITFYDDSKGTNVGSVVMSLASFERDVVLILGGRDKGGDYSPLKPLIQNKVKALIAVGEASERIATVFEGIKPLYCLESIKKAVEKSFEIGNEGDVVLLSPACSSFDQYKNYIERGEDFKKWVLHYGVE